MTALVDGWMFTFSEDASTEAELGQVRQLDH